MLITLDGISVINTLISGGRRTVFSAVAAIVRRPAGAPHARRGRFDVVDDDEFIDASGGHDQPDHRSSLVYVDRRIRCCGVHPDEEVRKKGGGEGDPGEVDYDTAASEFTYPVDGLGERCGRTMYSWGAQACVWWPQGCQGDDQRVCPDCQSSTEMRELADLGCSAAAFKVAGLDGGDAGRAGAPSALLQ